MSQPARPLPGPGPRRPATIADWEAVPAPYTAHLIDGVLYAMGRPKMRHSEASKQLVRALTPFDRRTGEGGPGGWLIQQEVDVRIAGNIVSPDLVGWRRERMATMTDITPVPLAPDWACEVLSPSTETFDRGQKSGWYASVGIGWLWFVDPEAKTLEVYQNDAGQWRPVGRWQGEDEVVAPPFAAAPWALGGLWG